MFVSKILPELREDERCDSVRPMISRLGRFVVCASPVVVSLTGAAATMLWSSSALAQSSASALIGSITDRATGKPVGGVQVVATSNSLQGEQTVESDSSGSYRLPNLPAGSYTLQFFKGGYKPFTSQRAIVVRSGQTIRFNVPLQPEGVEEIEIVLEAPTVDVSKSSTGSSIDQETIRKVPVVSAASAPTKSFESIAVMTPGAQSDQYGTSIAGSTSPENGYKVDGISVGNPAYGTNGSGISLEFLSEVQVISGGYMPEYGRSTGGTILATTRSGSNRFHGAVWSSVSPGMMEGRRSRVARDAGSVITETKLDYVADVGAVVDGPIIKDKLWFGTGLQLSRQRYDFRRAIWARTLDENQAIVRDPQTKMAIRTEVPGTASQHVGQASQLQGFAKLTYAVNQDHRISVSAFYAPYLDGDKKHLDLKSGTMNRDLNGSIHARSQSLSGSATDVAVNWLGSADNKRWTFDTSLAMHRQVDDTLPRDRSRIGQSSLLMDAPHIEWGFAQDLEIAQFEEAARGQPLCQSPEGGPVLCEARNYATGGMGGVGGRVHERNMYRYQLRHSTGRSFIWAGHHNAKAGIDIEMTSYLHKKAYTGRTSMRDLRGQGAGFDDYRQFSVVVSPDDIRLTPSLTNYTTMQVYGAYLQDSWSVFDKVTLNLGVRYDGLFMQGSDRDRFVALPLQVAPRMGVIWDPTQEGRSKIFAQYARYYQGMSLDMADRMGSIDAAGRTTHSAQACAGLQNDPTNTQACFESRDGSGFHSDGTANRQSATIAHAKTPVDPNLKPQSSDEISLGAEYNVFESARIGVYYQKRWQNRIIEDVSRDDGATYFIANPCEGFARDFPCAVRKFDALSFVFSKTYARHWLAQVSYQWSKSRGNIAGLFRPENGQLDPNITSEFDLLSLLPNREGDLPSDRRHEIKAFVGGDYSIGARGILEGGLALSARSGAPTNYLGSHLAYGLGQSFLLKRGTGERMPWTSEINLNLGGGYGLGASGRIKASVEIFNVFNAQGETARDQNYGLDSRLMPLPDETDPQKLEAQLDMESVKLANELNAASNVTDPQDPKFISAQEARSRIKNPNFGNPIAYQPPRSFRFTLRYEF